MTQISPFIIKEKHHLLELDGEMNSVFIRKERLPSTVSGEQRLC